MFKWVVLLLHCSIWSGSSSSTIYDPFRNALFEIILCHSARLSVLEWIFTDNFWFTSYVHIHVCYTDSPFLLGVSANSLEKCGQPPYISNGNVNVTDLTVGSVATYHCNDKFHVVGPSVLRCQATGNWSHSPPICTSNNYNFSFLPSISVVVLLDTTARLFVTQSCHCIIVIRRFDCLPVCVLGYHLSL